MASIVFRNSSRRLLRAYFSKLGWQANVIWRIAFFNQLQVYPSWLWRSDLFRASLGFIPNFYVVYDRHPVPLTSKLKFKLALSTTMDPITFLGSAFVAGGGQAADKYDYQQGGKGYAQSFGASYANGLTDILVGGAILPSILHQDPRFFYQGTGMKKSRILHAFSYPIICRGDNGHLQPNYSSLGGFLVSGAIANAYFPESNRGPGLVFSIALVDLAANMANGLLQEFVLRR